MQTFARWIAGLAAATSLAATAGTTPMSRLEQYHGHTAQGGDVMLQVLVQGPGRAVVQQVVFSYLGVDCAISKQGFGVALAVETAAPVAPDRTAEIAVSATAFVFTIDLQFGAKGTVRGRIAFTDSALTPDEPRIAEVCPSGPVIFQARTTGSAQANDGAQAGPQADLRLAVDVDAQGHVLRQTVQRVR